MPVEITMPQFSDTMTEGAVVKWHKKEGDKVKKDEVIADIETDKAVMEMQAFDNGTFAKVVAAEGTKVPVGGVLAILAVGKENPAEVKQQAGAKAAAGTKAAAPAPAAATNPPPATPATTPALRQAPPSSAPTFARASHGEVHEPDHVGHGATRSAATAVPPMRTRDHAGSGGNGNGENGNNENGGGRIFASPLARRIAADQGIDLRHLRGSGPGGRIVQRDVLEYRPGTVPVPASESGVAEGQSPATTATAAPPSTPAADLPGFTDGKQVIPMTKMRSAIAAALQKSKQSIPHFYETIDIDVEEVSKLRERMNKQLEKQKIRLSLADFIVKAVATTLARHPALNARFDPTKNEFTRFADVNLGIAVAVPDGLIVPVLRGVGRMGLAEIRQKSAELIDRARSQRLKQGEQGTGTFTVSSLGTTGVREFSAIINPPEVAILAVGSAEKRAVVRGEAIVARTMLTVTLSADHRAVDGAVAAEFLGTLKSILEEPGMMLL